MKRLLVSFSLLLTLLSAFSAWGIELRQVQPVTQQPAAAKPVIAPVLVPDILKVAVPPEAPALFVTLTQGRSYALKLSTKNFDLSKQLSFGDGVVLLDKPAMSGTEVTLNIKVNANAPVGKHAIVITSGTQPKTATAYLNVAAATVQPVKIQPLIKPAAEAPVKEITIQPISGAPKAVITPPPANEPVKDIVRLPLPPKPPVAPVAPIAGAIKKDAATKIGSEPVRVEPRQLPVKDLVKLNPQQEPSLPVAGRKPLETVNRSEAAPVTKPAPRPVPVAGPPPVPPAPPLPRPVYTMPASPPQTAVQQARTGVPSAPADRVPAPGIPSRHMREVSGFNFTGNMVTRSREVPNVDFAGSPVSYSREILKTDFIGSP
ncbi:MAG: hypothetical protein EPN25_13625 [Nitrospirae bacterium]|nr:MAG: hypothetical protein EPN25_13625 [Nitrospirota bacterium]